MAGLSRLRLGQAEARDVRSAECGAGDVDVDERVRRETGGRLDRDDPLVRRLVRKRGTRDQVADRVDAFARGALGAVDCDQPALAERYPGRLESQPGDVGAPADGEHQPVHLDLLARGCEAHRARGALDVLDRRGGVDGHPLAGEAARDDLRDVLILGRQHAIENLEQMSLRTKARVGRGDLAARGPGTEHGETARQLGERPRLLRPDDAFAELDARDRARDRPGGEDDRLGAQLVVADQHRPVREMRSEQRIEPAGQERLTERALE